MLFSYAFLDAGLLNFLPSSFVSFFQYYRTLAIDHRSIAAGIYVFIITFLFTGYALVLRYGQMYAWKTLVKYVLIGSCVLALSFPAFTYDIFNYVTTTKMVYFYHENPYVTMPIEIENEPYLAFTRAANKVALYGPTWIVLSVVPHFLGNGNIWSTMYAFKFMNALWYVGFCYLIWRVTKNIKNVIFFALNPLILMEILVSGHNDIVMMVLACGGLLLWQKKEWMNRFIGLFIFILSIFIKGATIVLVPLLFFRKMTQSRLMLIASCLLFFTFVIAAPTREELYPWYAVWFLSTAAFLPYSKYAWLWQFCIALSLGLEFRHVPYMAMGYYEGPGPMLRTVLTVIPPFIWCVWMCWKKRLVSSKFIK
jgi:hypothetical protein